MKLRLNVQKSPKIKEGFEHAGPVVTIGRNPDSTLVLDHDAVSWDHAKLELTPYQATITDLGSTNGTYKNEQQLKDAQPLWPGDTIRFGQAGPTLTILELDLTSEAAVPPPARSKKPVASATRGIAMQAVQELMTQQEELRAHRRSAQKQKTAFMAASVVLIVLLALLGAGLYIFSDKLGLIAKRTDDVENKVGQVDERVGKTDDHVKKVAGDVGVMAENMVKFDRDLGEQKKKQEQADKALNDVALNAARAEAAQRGGLDKLREMAVSLNQLNQQLAKANAAAAPAPVPAPARPAPPPIPEKPIRIEPGERVDVIIKNKGFYTGSLIGMDGTRVKVQTIPDPKAKASEWDIREVQAFQTRDGIFAFNESTGQFESAVTFFKFNKSTQNMERMESSQDSYLAQDAQVLGPTNSARAMLSVGATGAWCVGLPLPASKSPQSLPAYHFKQIVTSKGVYTFDDAAKDYVYKPHTQIAQEAREANDAYWANWRKMNWDRRVQEYELGTKRLEAIAPLFWRPWYWW